jgi:actinorhodin biosynthesis protein ActVIA
VSSTTDTASADHPAWIASGGGPRSEPPYAAIQALYAQQAWDLDRGDADAFAATFTADAAFEHVSSGEVLRGPEQIAAALRRTAEARRGAVYRHWFAQLWLDPVDSDTLKARYYAIVSVTDAKGAVAWDPSCVVEDELIRAGSQWLTRRRVVRRDDLLLG